MDVPRHRTAGRDPAARRRIIALAGLAVVVSMTTTVSGLAWAGFQGQLADSMGSFSSGTMLLEGTTPVSVVCTSSTTSAPISANSASCPGDPLPTGTLSATAADATTTLSEPGTSDPTAATLSSTTCGVAQLADNASDDTGLAMGGVTYGQTGPLGGSGIAFDGSSGWFESTASYSSPGSFTLLAWFKAAAGATGTILSVSNSQFDTGATTSDLDLWIGPSGQLVWGIVTLAGDGSQVQSEVTSSSAVTDGSWHLAAATYSGLTSTLYVDGASQGSVEGVTGLLAYNGYPSLGWGPVDSTGWSGAPTSDFFGGTLSMVSLSPAATSAADISTLAGESTPTAYESALSSIAPPSENWEMADPGTTPFTGSVDVLGGGTTTPCQRVEVTVQQVQGGTTSCVVPAGTGPCPAPDATTLVPSIGTATLDVPTKASPVQLTVTLALAATSPTGVAGLHVLPDLTFDASRPSWSADLDYAGASVQL